MNTMHSVFAQRIPRWVLSSALLVCSGWWLASAGVYYAASGFKNDGAVTPPFWLLLLLVTPAVCFALALTMMEAGKIPRLSRLDAFALAGALFPVTLGTVLAIWVSNVLFWTNSIGM